MINEEQLAAFLELDGEALIALGEKLQELGRAIVGQEEETEKQLGPFEAVSAFAPAAPIELSDDKVSDPSRSVGRFGLVTHDRALYVAQDLQTFDRAVYAEKLGLKGAQATRWLSMLMDEGALDYQGGVYECLTLPSIRDWIVRQTEPFTPSDASRATGLGPMDTMERIEHFEAKGVIKQVGESGMFKVIPANTLPGPREHVTKRPPENEPPSFLEARATGMPVRVKATQKATRRQRSVAGAGGIKGAKARDKRFERAEAAKAQRAEAQKTKAQKQPNWKTNSRRAAA